MAACISQPAGARPKKHHHHRASSHRISLDVAPMPEIDEQVANEVAKAGRILDNLQTDNFLSSGYVVSAVYYHDGFLAGFPVERSSAAPERRIIGQISGGLTQDQKVRFVQLLHEIWAASAAVGPERLVKPVNYLAASGGRRSHRYAIDLFAAEGAPVHSVSRGVVILADRDWSLENLFSTTSRKGGNAVIVFDPDHERFYRYCHLSAVDVSAGQIVASGQPIGTVGHSGLNASRPGHGRHLHFEVNEYSNGQVRAMEYRRLKAMLRQWPVVIAD